MVKPDSIRYAPRRAKRIIRTFSTDPKTWYKFQEVARSKGVSASAYLTQLIENAIKEEASTNTPTLDNRVCRLERSHRKLAMTLRQLRDVL